MVSLNRLPGSRVSRPYNIYAGINPVDSDVLPLIAIDVLILLRSIWGCQLVTDSPFLEFCLKLVVREMYVIRDEFFRCSIPF